MNIILFDKNELIINGSTRISVFLSRRDERAEHLLKVLHKKTGDNFDAGVLGGKLGTGIIKETTAEGLFADLSLDTESLPRTPLRLGVGFPRPIQLRRLLRDCASLGLVAVDLIGTELGEKSYRNTKLLDDGGARSALIEGAIQARDTRLPELAVFPNLAAWLKTLTRHDRTVLIAADNIRPAGNFSSITYPNNFSPETNAVLAVGSERGWSGREREQLEQAGFIRLSLGKRSFRTETACTIAAALIMEKMGLLDGAAYH